MGTLLDNVTLFTDPPLRNPWYTGAVEGRYVFVLGHRRYFPSHGDIFDLDVIDFFVHRHTRIVDVGPFRDLGEIFGFYALSPDQLVILDNDEVGHKFGQRRVHVNLDTFVTRVVVERQYAFRLGTARRAQIGNGPLCGHWAVCSGSYRVAGVHHRPVCLVPVDPTPSFPLHRDITALNDTGRARVRQHNRSNRAAPLALLAHFMINDNTVGVFLRRRRILDTVPMALATRHVLILDVEANTATVRETASRPLLSTQPIANFYGGLAAQCEIIVRQANFREVIVAVDVGGVVRFLAWFNTRDLEWTEQSFQAPTLHYAHHNLDIIAFRTGNLFMLADDVLGFVPGTRPMIYATVGSVHPGNFRRFQLYRFEWRVLSLRRQTAIDRQRQPTYTLAQRLHDAPRYNFD